MHFAGLSLQEHFEQLDQFLINHQSIWRPAPFTHLQLDWETHYPELSVWLRQRSLDDAEHDQNNPGQLQAPAPFTRWAEIAMTLSRLPVYQAAPPITAPFFNIDIPGRKWQQINAFAGSLQFSQSTQHWVDWCAGKGHLGRLLGHNQTRFTCLEYDPALVNHGAQLTEKMRLNGVHLCQNVMDTDIHSHLPANCTPVALHACGDLHRQLIQSAITKNCRQLALSPCCYNRIGADHYVPLSQQAKASALRLSKDDLRLPLTETVTANAAVRRQRDRSMAWRLAFDLLQRQLRQQNTYLTTPPLESSWFKKSFAQFCQDLAALRGLSCPQQQDWEPLEALGWQRLAHVRNLELVRALFRRPLEIWLVLDQALYLQEAGYQVRIGVFCPATLTPRNIQIQAEKY